MGRQSFSVTREPSSSTLKPRKVYSRVLERALEADDSGRAAQGGGWRGDPGQRQLGPGPEWWHRRWSKGDAFTTFEA